MFFILLPNNKLRLLGCFALIASIAFLLRPYFAPETSSNNFLAVRFRSHLRFDSLFVGVVLALLHKENALPTIPSQKSFKVLAVMFSWFAIALFFLIPGATHQAFSHTTGFTILWVLAGALVALAIVNDSLVFDIPVLGPCLAFIGRRSFSIYLCHSWANYMSQEFAWQWFDLSPQSYPPTLELAYMQVFVPIGICAVATELCYRFVEGPANTWGQRLSQKLLIQAHDIEILPITRPFACSDKTTSEQSQAS